MPGLVELQGVGEPGTSRPWDCWWDCGPKPFRHVYAGAAWYRRTVDIPSAWAGRRIWIKVGGVASQGWFWVNGTQVAWVDAYCGTYKYEITDLVTPGRPAKFVVQTSNEVASRTGNRNSRNRWCGIPRALALEARPRAFMYNVRLGWTKERMDADERVDCESLRAGGNRLHVRRDGCGR